MSGLQAGTRRGRRDATGPSLDDTAAPAAGPGPAAAGSDPVGATAASYPTVLPADVVDGLEPGPDDNQAGPPGAGAARADRGADRKVDQGADRDGDRDADWSDGAPPGRLEPGWADAVTAPYPVADAAERPFVHVGEILAPDRSPTASPTVRPGSPRDAAEGEDG
jgi:hypothetical protein